MSVPAGLWRRYAAWSLDAVIIALPTALLTWPAVTAGWIALVDAFQTLSKELAGKLIDGLQSSAPPAALAEQWLRDPTLLAATAALQTQIIATVWPPLCVFVSIGLLYSVGFERSSWRATPGRRALGLSVIDRHGYSLTTERALWRYCAGGLSWLTLNIGHLMAGIPPQHVALHDVISGTRVRMSARAPMPLWANIWLTLQLIAVFLTFVWGMSLVYLSLQTALEQAMRGPLR